MEKDSPQSQGIARWPAKAAIVFIRAYQLLISPWLGSHCRFTPTCSQYAIEAYQHYGLWQGSWLSLKRIAKCHPWHSGGYDSVKKDGAPNTKTEIHCCRSNSQNGS